MRPAFAFSVLALAAAALPARAAAPELVSEVQAASVTRLPHGVSVCARATVPTGGYSAPVLVPRGSGDGGVYDLDFKAVRPTGIATQMVSTIHATLTWADAPADLTAVRIHGEQGSVTAPLGRRTPC